jgi:ubiquinone/menaquinone biosynthesis C-methylase UbiE
VSYVKRVIWFAVLLVAVAAAITSLTGGTGVDDEVERLANLVELRPGMAVGEIGAGKGRMAIAVARRLGGSGRVFATELDPKKMQAIRNAAARAGLTNITVIQGGEQSTGLPNGCCDIIYMRRVYHHLNHADAINESLYSALRPGGRLAVIDLLLKLPFFRHGIASSVLIKQVIAAGFAVDHSISRWSRLDYCAVFTKPVRSGR